MNPYLPTDFPLEMRDLLIEVNARTKTIETTLQEIKTQNASLDDRLRKVENEQNVREGLKDRFIATESSVVDISKRLHTIETTAKTGASFADWCWRVIPTAAMVIFAVATFMAEQKNAAKNQPVQAPAAIVQQVIPPQPRPVEQ